MGPFRTRLFTTLILGTSAIHLAAVPAYADSSELCVNLLRQNFRGREIEIKSVTNLPTRSGFAYRSILFPNTNEVLLGIQEGAQRHAYLIVEGTRYDGNFLKSPVSVNHRTIAFPSGIVMRFMDIHPKSQMTLRNHFASLTSGHSYAATCYHGACSELAAGGLTLGKDSSRSLPKRPSEILKKIIDEGFFDTTGERVKVEIYQTSPETLESIYSTLRKRENNHLIQHAFTWTLVAASAGGIVTLAIIAANEDEEPFTLPTGRGKAQDDGP
jgi:hypothetical protein